MDGCAADARSPSRCRSNNGPGGRVEGRCEGAAPGGDRRPARRSGRSDGSGGHRRAPAPQRRRRCEGFSQRSGPVDEGRHHLRLVPLVGGQLPGARNRQAAGRMGQHRFECRRDRRAVACPGRGDEGGVQRVGAGQVRPAAPCVRRHATHSVEQPLAADRDPADLRPRGRRIRDRHGRRPDLLLEQLRRRRTDGRSRQVQRSAHRALHQPDARSGHAEAGGAAGLSTEPAFSEGTRGQFRPRGGRARQASVPRQGALQHVPSRPDVHRRAQRSGTEPADPARSGGGRHGSALRDAIRHGPLPDDALAGPVAARAVLPRWQRCRPPCRGGALRQAVPAEPVSATEGRPGGVP